VDEENEISETSGRTNTREDILDHTLTVMEGT